MDKHITNSPRSLALDSLQGLVLTHPTLSLHPSHRIILRSAPTHISTKVQLISGGGSGHEPSFAGMVGEGLLDAAVCGNVFASPNVGQISRGVELLSQGGQGQGQGQGQGKTGASDEDEGKKGVLMIIMRYTGDYFQFGLTLEKFKSTHPTLPIELLVVGDDVAVTRTQGKIVGRRGLAGTCLIHKIAGGLAARGWGLREIKEGLDEVVGRVGTIGAGLGHCSVPGSGGKEEDAEVEDGHGSTSALKANEIEIGMGIHNEPGVLTLPLTSASDLIPKMLEYITNTADKERSFVPFSDSNSGEGGDEVVLLVNNLGGLSELEMGLIAREAVGDLEGKGMRVRRVGVGRYMTSINLPGFSLTILLLPSSSTSLTSTQILETLDAPTDAPGWIPLYEPRKLEECVVEYEGAGAGEGEGEGGVKKVKREGKQIAFSDTKLFIKAVEAACESVIAAEPEITKFDTIAGDGDCGTCLKAGAEEILQAIKDGLISDEDVPSAIIGIAEAMERKMDGTSGALYSIWTNALAAAFTTSPSPPTSSTWSTSLSSALQSLYKYTNARPPSRTLVDPLDAFTNAFAESDGADLGGAIEQARVAAEKTRELQAKAGRAAYVGQETLMGKNVPDPGAWGVLKILEGLQKVLS